MKAWLSNLSLANTMALITYIALVWYAEHLGMVAPANLCEQFYSWQVLLSGAASLYALGVLFALLLGDFLGLYGVFTVLLSSLLPLWLCLCASLGYFIFEGGVVHINYSDWLRLFDSLDVRLSFCLDSLSFSFLFLTVTIALFVLAYAFSYFRYEPNVDRLLLLLNLFVLSMCALVSSGNLVLLFLGWESIGLSSFLLINFWQTRVGTLKAAFKAYTFNKVSDAAMLLGLCTIFVLFGDLSYASCNSLAVVYSSAAFDHLFKLRLVELSASCIMLASFVKSAQLGFHVWLPDSMEAPVPASALIHSATLVSAGIFIVLRLQPIMELSLVASSLLPVVGSATALVGGFSALYQTDLKRVLAYSTISHCGFLFILSTLAPIEFTLLYLYVHGFFKASSFLCVGNVIRFSKNYQDSRRMGYFWKYLPSELFFLFFCLANLAGLPLFLGFTAKHLVLGSSMPGILGFFVTVLCLLSALCGLFYSSKVFFFVFFDSRKARRSIYSSASASSARSAYYSNTTLASNFSIASLALVAYLACFTLASGLVFSTSSSLVDLGHQLSVALPSYSYAPDSGTSLNARLLNHITLIFFFFMSFFSWSRQCTFNFSSSVSLLLALILV